VSGAHQILPAPRVDRVEHTPRVGVRWHEYADIFPWIEGAAREELKADIKKNGVLEPIVFIGEYILDGRNRYDIARELGISYPRVEYEGTDPLAFVISRNLSRRQLTDKQRADVAAKLAKLPKGANQHTPIGGPSIAQAAKMMDVSVKAVERAKAVQEHAVPEVKAAYDAGEIAPSVAADIASLPHNQQIEVIKNADPKALRAAVKQVRAIEQVAKKERRVEREAALAEKIQALPGKRYGVILADPEWRFEPYSRETGMDRAADNHYPTSAVEEIMARDVASIAADDCVLFLWATAPMLPQALQVMSAWGFTYKTHAIWFKQRAGEGRGTGYWFLGEHELLLVGVRGDVVAPAMGTQARSVFLAPVGGHSEKPDVSLMIIETYFPTLPKIELNRRGPARPGWDAWGLEAEGEAA
jgi:N6-adenosine-specific RNA methylase IME4